MRRRRSSTPGEPGHTADLDVHHQIAQRLWMEAAAGAAWAHLADAGISAIVLKGPAIAHWLYRADELRVSRDVDILVAPDDFERAQASLAGIGYQTRLAGAPACEIGPNSMMLLGSNGVCIDLHHRLIGVDAVRGRCWEVLSQHTVPLPLATGVAVDVLDVGARAMHLALHAAQSGRADTKAMADLERGLQHLRPDDWRAAADVAGVLDALPAFAAGLSLCPSGRELAERLALRAETSVELQLRISGAPAESLFFVRLAEVRGIGGKVAVVARKLWPTPAFMRANYPRAAVGRAGLVVARLERPVVLIARGTPAVIGWFQARARARRSMG